MDYKLSKLMCSLVINTLMCVHIHTKSHDRSDSEIVENHKQYMSISSTFFQQRLDYWNKHWAMSILSLLPIFNHLHASWWSMLNDRNELLTCMSLNSKDQSSLGHDPNIHSLHESDQPCFPASPISQAYWMVGDLPESHHYIWSNRKKIHTMILYLY